MSFIELYTSRSLAFGGLERDFGEADYVVSGVPFDVTSTYRSGSRFAPKAIREASLNIETYSFRSGTDFEEVKLHDLGDLDVSGDVKETLRRLELVTGEVFRAGKMPILIGGEHTITLGAIRGFGKDVAVLSFDAHLDLRHEYMGRRLGHATFMRRIAEEKNVSRTIEVGTRAVCQEEIKFVRKSGIRFFTSDQIIENGVKEVSGEIRGLLKECEGVYLSLDMDVLDPAFAPGVQNPEPDGLSTRMLLNLICEVCSDRVAALDVTEVTPPYDTGVTAVQAAKAIIEAVCCLERSKGR